MGGGLLGYLRRQYGYGYGRLDLIAKHPTRYGGDDVSGPRMLHAAGATVALGALGATPFLALVGVPPPLPLALSGLMLLAACGNKGPLFIPEPPAEPQPASGQ